MASASKGDLKALKREISLQKSLIHPNIVKLIAAFEKDERLYIVLECLERNLFDYMRGRVFEERVALKIFLEICKAVEFVHSRKLIHRDIKPENVLLDRNGGVKLCDFGFCAPFGGDEARVTMCGTKEYLPPEIIKELAQTDKVDVWCLGVLLFERIHKRLPFEAKNTLILLESIKRKKIAFKQSLHPDTKELLERCLEEQPERRPTMIEILASRAFNLCGSKPGSEPNEQKTRTNEAAQRSKTPEPRGARPPNSHENNQSRSPILYNPGRQAIPKSPEINRFQCNTPISSVNTMPNSLTSGKSVGQPGEYPGKSIKYSYTITRSSNNTVTSQARNPSQSGIERTPGRSNSNNFHVVMSTPDKVNNSQSRIVLPGPRPEGFQSNTSIQTIVRSHHPSITEKPSIQIYQRPATPTKQPSAGTIVVTQQQQQQHQNQQPPPSKVPVHYQQTASPSPSFVRHTETSFDLGGQRYTNASPNHSFVRQSDLPFLRQSDLSPKPTTYHRQTDGSLSNQQSVVYGSEVQGGKPVAYQSRREQPPPQNPGVSSERDRERSPITFGKIQMPVQNSQSSGFFQKNKQVLTSNHQVPNCVPNPPSRSPVRSYCEPDRR